MWSVQTNKGDKQMKTIYKQPRATKPEANEVQRVLKLNSTGTLRRVEGTRYDLIVSYNTPIAYVVDVENGTFLNETKVILCNEFYSMTTRKHQAEVKKLYSGCAIGEFDLFGFFKRAEIDKVDVRGGANGGYNINRTEFF
tara:strand:- start:117 stop:536 length:420 start_codon:yes stop_codon:yes gene_type:complete